MSNDISSRRELSKNIAAILNSYDNSLYNEQEKEDVSSLPISLIQKKLKKIHEQLIFFHAENRLLYNYLIWYEKKILKSSSTDYQPSYKSKQTLSIDKRREIAESSFKVLLSYSQKYGINVTQYVDECINRIETDEEIINHLELELITLEKFHDFINTQKKLNAEEFLEFLKERIRYRETLNERKRQQIVRLRFNINNIEKSIRKVREIVDTITEIDFEQLKIDIDKQLKELNIKNQMLIFYKRQQSEANTKLNEKKPQLFKEIRELTSIRNGTNTKLHQINHYEKIKQKMLNEILEYEKLNEPLREMIISYRVPSIINYVDLKTKQLNLHRQIHAWERKLQITQGEFHQHQIELIDNPEKIIHPWKYLQNPSSILFYKHSKTSVNHRNELSSKNTLPINNK